MTTETVPSVNRRSVGLFATNDFGFAPKVRKVTKVVHHAMAPADGEDPGEDETKEVTLVEKIPVFRSGTFRDSNGMQATYEPIHMDNLVSHFNLLRDRLLFADVPVRDGHPGWLIRGQEGSGKLVGYTTALYAEERVSPVDGKTYTYLLADFEIIDDCAQENVASGLWRNRSAEIGTFHTNDDAEFWPVYMGCAYVDIPAVQGLNGFSMQIDPSQYRVMFEGAVPEGTVQALTPEVSTDKESQPVTTPAVPAVPGATDAPPAVVPPVTEQGTQHSAPVAPQAFSVNGAAVTDFAAVQAHINSLESFASESIRQARTDFVAKLAGANQIAATQTDSLTAFALGLSQEQYDAWKTSMELSPAMSLLGQHGKQNQQGEQGQPQPVGGTTAASEIEIARATVAMHRAGGMSPEKLAETPSYKRLVQLESQGGK